MKITIDRARDRSISIEISPRRPQERSLRIHIDNTDGDSRTRPIELSIRDEGDSEDETRDNIPQRSQSEELPPVEQVLQPRRGFSVPIGPVSRRGQRGRGRGRGRVSNRESSVFSHVSLPPQQRRESSVFSYVAIPSRANPTPQDFRGGLSPPRSPTLSPPLSPQSSFPSPSPSPQSPSLSPQSTAPRTRGRGRGTTSTRGGRGRGGGRRRNVDREPAAYISELGRHPGPSDIGNMNITCKHCLAKHWIEERVANSPKGAPLFEKCCRRGEVKLKALPPYPRFLQKILTDPQDPHYRSLRTQIRRFNAACCFTSCVYQPDKRLGSDRSGVKCFSIHGELYHYGGPLDNPGDISRAKYAQLFFYDPQAANQQRLAANPGLDIALIDRFIQFLMQHNPFYRLYRTAKERLDRAGSQDTHTRVLISPQLRLIVETGADQRRENLATADEVALLIPEDDVGRTSRDIVLARRNEFNADGSNVLYRISATNAAYFPLHYVLFFPRGGAGHSWDLRLLRENNNKISPRDFHRYRLHSRPAPDFNPFLHGGSLTQQYLVDIWAVIEQESMAFHYKNQDRLRADLYKGVHDMIAGDGADPAEFGRKLILPSSVPGSDRYMQQLYQDAMAIVREYGRADLFITFTANPKWPEITNCLLPGETASDRPDIISRVFAIKCESLRHDFRYKHCFGTFKAFIWTIEYQKRGLPHMHLLLYTTRDRASLQTAEVIDNLILAELPPPDIPFAKEITAIVRRSMTHGPCGEQKPNAACMQMDNGRKVCTKKFPRDPQLATFVHPDGYPLYRRREDTPCYNAAGDLALSGKANMNVVPYNPYLTYRYGARINVEVCSSIKSAKYIYKYIYKGGDRATVEVAHENDEIKRFLRGRYIGPSQAWYEIFGYHTHQEFPPVQRLQLHLPGEMTVAWDKRTENPQIAEILDNSTSTLLEFFKYYESHPDIAEDDKLIYANFPKHFVWVATGKHWKERQQGLAIGRIYHCSPTAGERFYLRLLLCNIAGPSSYEELRTFRGVLHPTFYEACRARGLVEDDKEWVYCFREARRYKSGMALRSLFVIAIIHGPLITPSAIWEQFRADFCDDLAYRLRTLRNVPTTMEDSHLDYGLYLIEGLLQKQGRSLAEARLPQYTFNWNASTANPLLAAELEYESADEQACYNAMLTQFNLGQREAHDCIVNGIANSPADTHLFVHGYAGTGKTFIYRALCHRLRARGEIVLCRIFRYRSTPSSWWYYRTFAV